MAKYYECVGCGKVYTVEDLYVADDGRIYVLSTCPRCNSRFAEIVTDGSELQKEKAKERVNERKS